MADGHVFQLCVSIVGAGVLGVSMEDMSGLAHIAELVGGCVEGLVMDWWSAVANLTL